MSTTTKPRTTAERAALRQAPFALRVVRRHDGDAAIIYRRTLGAGGNERFSRLASLGPLAYSAGLPLLRDAARSSSAQGARAVAEGLLQVGPFYPLDADWGARVACYALVANGLRDADRLHRAAGHLRRGDAVEAAWWLGLLQKAPSPRPLRALRILVEAVR